MDKETLEDMEIWINKIEALFKSPLLVKLKSLLAEAEPKPLEHGDCVIEYGVPRIVLRKKPDCSGKFAAFRKSATSLDEYNFAEQNETVVYFNAFKELEALSQEPIESFEKHLSGGILACAIYNNREIQISINSGSHTHCLYATKKEFDEAVLKCRRMQAKLNAEKEK